MDEATFRTGLYADGSPVTPDLAGRIRLPNRRDCDTIDFDWRGQRWSVSIHRDSAGIAREIFVNPAAANIAAILVSTLLQQGSTLADLVKRLTAGGWQTGTGNQPLIVEAMGWALGMEQSE